MCLWPLPASAASCGAPSPDLRASVGPSPPPCAAPVCAAPALASAPVSPPAAGPCVVSQSHTQTHTRPTLPCSHSNVDHSKTGRWRPAVPFVAEQQLPVQVLVAGCLHWGTVQPPGLNALLTALICCGLTGQRREASRGLWGAWNKSYHCVLTFNSSDLI